MHPTQIEELRKQFHQLDVSQAGQISFHDMRQVLGSLMSETDIQQLFDSVDYDKSRLINYHEFLAATVSRSTLKEENMRVAFERIANRREYFTGTDLSHVMGLDCTEDEVKILLQSQLIFFHFDGDCECLNGCLC